MRNYSLPDLRSIEGQVLQVALDRKGWMGSPPTVRELFPFGEVLWGRSLQI